MFLKKKKNTENELKVKTSKLLPRFEELGSVKEAHTGHEKKRQFGRQFLKSEYLKKRILEHSCTVKVLETSYASNNYTAKGSLLFSCLFLNPKDVVVDENL